MKMTKSKQLTANPREIALQTINEINVAGAYANLALAKELRHAVSQSQLSELDRRFTTELVYGVVKTGDTLDWLLSHYISRPLSKIAPVIRNILRLGMYQIFFLNKVPPSAACNQAVELTKKYGHQGTVKFVNAVLRSAVRNPEKIVYPDPQLQPIKYLALKYFHPEWLVKRWFERLGAQSCEALCQRNNETPHLSLRTNLLKITREELLLRLQKENVQAEYSDWTPEGIICSGHPALDSLGSLQEGLLQIQDESSMLVAHVLGPQPGEMIIDACGAPGGKSTHLAALMGNVGQVLSTDIHAHKLQLTEENAARLGIEIIKTQELDATLLYNHYAGQADRVLVDAPCSGLGVLRRKADSRWRKTEAMLSELPQLQTAILSSAAACLKPGGTLVYSTCTTEKEENENVITAFLASHPEFSLQITGQYLPVKKRTDTMLQFWPHLDQIDGFFIARLHKDESKER